MLSKFSYGDFELGEFISQNLNDLHFSGGPFCGCGIETLEFFQYSTSKFFGGGLESIITMNLKQYQSANEGSENRSTDYNFQWLTPIVINLMMHIGDYIVSL